MPFGAAAFATAAASGLLGLLVLLVLALLMMLVCRAVLGFVLVSLLLLLVLLGIERRGAHALVGRWWHAVGCGCGVGCVSSKFNASWRRSLSQAQASAVIGTKNTSRY